MKNLLCIIVGILLLSSCDDKREKSDANIFVTIAPIKFIVKEIIADDYQVNIIVPPGSSPETYEPSPQLLTKLNNTAFIFHTGLIDFEQVLAKQVTESSKAELVNLSEGIHVLTGSCSHHHHSGHGVDPHIWTSPSELKIMATNVYNAIIKQSPDSLKYSVNYQNLIAKLDEADRIIKEKIDSSSVKFFVIYHPALTYYSKRYGIEQISIENEGKEPTASNIKSIIETAKLNNINTIFYQKEFNKSSVEAVANEIGAKAIEIDPLNEDVINNLLHITNLLTSE